MSFGLARFQWEFLGTKFLVPRALSPLLSLVLVYLLAWPLIWTEGHLAGRCACVTQEAVIQSASLSAAALETTELRLTAGETQFCGAETATVALQGTAFLNGAHWFTSGLVGFARGWNDTPKIAALGLIALKGSAGMATAFGIVTIAMAVGGLIGGYRVLETLSHKLTPLALPGALTASATTAILVGLASWNGLPVSTTHVSTGAIIGAGIQHNAREVRWSKVGEIALSWLITLPVAALLAAIARMFVR